MDQPLKLADRAVTFVSGPDWRSFLQGLVTQDVDSLKSGELRYGALLSPQGRVLFDLFLLGQENGCLIDAPAEGRHALIQRLLMYRLRAKVEITPDERPVCALPGGDGGHADPRLPGLWRRAYDVEGAPDETEAYDAHRLALGVPGPADWGSDRLYALEANLDLLNAIEFHKGCFIGQETASRMKRRGQIKSRTLPIVFDGPAPAPGTEVRAGDHRAGEVLSGLDGRALALLRLDRIGDGALSANGRSVRVERPPWMAPGG